MSEKTERNPFISMLYVNRTGHVVEARQWLVETYRYVLCHFHGRLWRKKRQKTIKTLEDLCKKYHKMQYQTQIQTSTDDM